MWLRWAIPVAALIVGIAIASAAGGGDSAGDSGGTTVAQSEVRELEERLAAAKKRADAAEERVAAAEAEAQEASASNSTPPPAPSPEPAPAPAPEPDVTAGQENALGKAEDYLSFSAFSRSGLIEQLEFEGFTTADATWAVDNLAVDWNEQAAKKAEDYLSFSSFSRSGLIDQLMFDGFTREQAEHGASAAGF